MLVLVLVITGWYKCTWSGDQTSGVYVTLHNYVNCVLLGVSLVFIMSIYVPQLFKKNGFSRTLPSPSQAAPIKMPGMLVPLS